MKKISYSETCMNGITTRTGLFAVLFAGIEMYKLQSIK